MNPMHGLNAMTTDPEIEKLLHPAAAFDHPKDVLNDPDLTTAEKRAILSSWASDACAVPSCPGVRQLGHQKPVSFDDVMDALKSLDDDDPPPRPGGRSVRWKSGPQGPDLGGLGL